MEHTGRTRAVGLASLLLVALLGGVGSVADVAAADQGSISFDDSTYAADDTVTVTVADGDLSTTEEYVVNVQSDSEGQVIVSGERLGSSKTHTTDVSVADSNSDNKVTRLDIEYNDRDKGGNKVTSVTRNKNGTVTLTFQNPPGVNDGLSYTRGETIALSHEQDDQFTGSTEISSTDSIGTLQVNEGDIINTSYFDDSGGTNLTTTAVVDNDSEPLTLGPITELSTDSLAGTSLTHTESVIEVPFSEDVSKAGGAAGAPTLGGNVTVSVDGENVTDRYVLDADGSADGQIVVTSATPVAPGSDVAVAVDAVNDSADTETLTPGVIDMTVTDASVTEGGDVDAYANETVAFVAGDADRPFEVTTDDGAFAFAGRTGNGSQVFAFDSAARNWSGAYAIESTGSAGATTDLALRDLGLSVRVETRTVTIAGEIDARLSAADSGRTVVAALETADGAVVDRRTRILGGNGDATVAFGGDSLAAAGPGNYTINVSDAATGAAVDSDRIRVVAADERTAAFDSTVTTEHAGDVATLDVELRYADAATVTVGGADVGGRANVTVADRDDDGRVRVRFNTAAAAGATTLPDDGGSVFGTAPVGANASGTPDAVVAADAGGFAAASAGLDPGEYDLTVRPGATASAAATGVGTLTLRQPSPRRLDTLVAPANATLSTPAEVSTAADAGRLTDVAAVATGDLVVHRIVAPGLAGALADAPGNDTESFFGLAGRGSGARYGLNVTQRARDADSNANPYRLRLNNTTARVVADAANDTYFVIYRSDGPAAVPWNGTAETGPADPEAPAAGDSLSAAFTVHADGPFADLERADRRVTTNHSLVAARIDAADPIVVTNATNQSVTGRTTLAPGSAFDLRIRSNGTDRGVLRTARATVGLGGGWNATVDFDGLRVGDTFTIRSAADTVAPAHELAVDSVVRTDPAGNASTATATPEATATPTSGSGGGGGGGGSGDGDDDPDPPSPEPTTAATTTGPPDAGGSVIDSTRQFLGGVLGSAVDDDAESIRDRLFDFDVAVVSGALVVVVLYAARRG